MAKTTLTVVLNRDGHDQRWGFRLRGGVDLKEPLIVQKVSVCSPAEGELRKNDVLTNINGHDTANLTHQNAQDLIKNAGNTISLAVNRAGSGQAPAAPASSNVAPKVAPAAPTVSATSARKVSTMSGQAVPRKISDIMASPVENLPVTVFPSSDSAALAAAAEEIYERERERALVTLQPYRTTPLVLPGAKARRDSAGVTSQSYLRLQQNPLQWSSPPQPTASHPSVDAVNNALLKQKDVRVFEPTQGWKAHDEEVVQAAEQKVSAADTAPQHQVVHKQFNSPMGLYSKENIDNTLKAQTGVEVTEPAPSVRHYDPRQSDTFIALQEAEINAANRGRSQARPPPQKAHVVNAAPFKVTKVNSLGVPEEKILQSYSFRRIMADVLGETDF